MAWNFFNLSLKRTNTTTYFLNIKYLYNKVLKLKYRRGRKVVEEKLCPEDSRAFLNFDDSNPLWDIVGVLCRLRTDEDVLKDVLKDMDFIRNNLYLDRPSISYPRFLMRLSSLYKLFEFRHLLTNSLFHANKQNIFVAVPKMGVEVRRRASLIIQCSMETSFLTNLCCI